MKSKLTMAGLMVVLVLSLLACSSPAASEVSVEVSIDDLMSQKHINQQVEVKAGDTLKVILGSNPSTGFSWDTDAQVNNQDVLTQIGHRFIVPDGVISGAAGKDEWMFQAKQKGSATVSLEYSRPWEGGEKGEWTFNLTVVVE